MLLQLRRHLCAIATAMQTCCQLPLVAAKVCASDSVRAVQNQGRYSAAAQAAKPHYRRPPLHSRRGAAEDHSRRSAITAGAAQLPPLRPVAPPHTQLGPLGGGCRPAGPAWHAPAGQQMHIATRLEHTVRCHTSAVHRAREGCAQCGGEKAVNRALQCPQEAQVCVCSNRSGMMSSNRPPCLRTDLSRTPCTWPRS